MIRISRNNVGVASTNIDEHVALATSRMNDRQSLFLGLLEDNHGRWRAIARSYAGNDTEDLLQEILMQIWRSLDTFRGDSASSTWCYRVALNTAMSWRRSEQSRRQRLPICDDRSVASAPTPARNPDCSELLEWLMAELSAADKAILLLSLDNVSYSEMAEIVGATEGALRVRVHRIKQRLAQLDVGLHDGL
jgi:RNA polymerase sigma-70 factor (ECF subfamily)